MKNFNHLKTFSSYQLEALYITEQNFYSINPNENKSSSKKKKKKKTDSIENDNNIIEEIIAGDKIKELEELYPKRFMNLLININKIHFHKDLLLK